MIIKLNDKPYEVEPGTTLLDFVESIGLKKDGIAIASGYQVIPKSTWDKTILNEDQELMLIHAVSGG